MSTTASPSGKDGQADEEQDRWFHGPEFTDCHHDEPAGAWCTNRAHYRAVTYDDWKALCRSRDELQNALAAAREAHKEAMKNVYGFALARLAAIEQTLKKQDSGF